MINIADDDNNAKYRIDGCGYRTSNNQYGLGYLETQAELAHMQGVMLRQMIRGKFTTHNLTYLFFVAVFGLLVGVTIFAL